MSGGLSLAEHVHLCVANGHCVFLDLARDQYFAVPLIASDNSDADGGGEARCVIAQALSTWSQELVRSDLVVIGREVGQPISERPTLIAPAAHLFEPRDGRPFGLAGEVAGQLGINARDMRDAFAEFCRASHMLKHWRILDTVEHIRRLKVRHSMSPSDITQARHEAAVFARLRPWLPGKYHCLRDSLALTLFLYGRGVTCSWVFGVQMQPFGAHSWTEVGGLVANDSLEYARQFTPILAV